MDNKQYILEEIEEVCLGIKDMIKDRTFIFIFGDLGAGKTTLVKNLLHLYGIKKDNIVSPTYTYSLLHKASGLDIAHIDLYRVLQGKFDENLYSYIEDQIDLFLIEWPDRIGDELFNYIRDNFNCIDIHIKIVDDTKRLINIK